MATLLAIAAMQRQLPSFPFLAASAAQVERQFELYGTRK
jgi:hypothetical protein